MITWGISANSHDAALAVFVDNRLIFASHSERFSGKKNDRDLCSELVEYARQWGEPDKICWYENPYLKTARQLWAGQGWKWKSNNIRKYLKKWNINAPIQYTTHHHSHAAAGYFTSEYTDATVVVIDAIGEFDTLTIWKGDGDNLTKLYSQGYPHSIGLFYSAMTQRVHLKPNEDEYILMGMAAYGDNSLDARVEEDFIGDYTKHTFKSNLHKGCTEWAPDLIIKDTFDIASATQHTYEKMFEQVLKHAKELNNSSNLILMGGCALNCAANPIALKHFKNVWIMPNPGDAGSAIGAVLAQTHERSPWTSPYLGFDMGYTTSNQDIVDYLAKEHICGVARGKAEFGPRALGNRSLFADPRRKDIKEIVNNIKQRQQFRPFAPVVLEEHADRYFELIGDHRYMQYAVRCKHPITYQAIAHKDETSRVQTVGKNDDPQLRDLLERWHKKTGCPMLLNTSLNIKGHPMVNDAADALIFETTYNVKVFN